MENLSFCQFWARCFKDAFSRGWKTGGAVNAILSLVVPFAPLLDAHSTQHLAQWTWIGTYSVALATLGAIWLVFATRLIFYAPYLVYRECASAANVEIKSQQSKRIDVEQKLDRREHYKLLVSLLTNLTDKGHALEKRLFSKSEPPVEQSDILIWLDEVERALEHPDLGNAYVTRMNNREGSAMAYIGYNQEFANRVNLIKSVTTRLLEFAQEFMILSR